MFSILKAEQEEDFKSFGFIIIDFEFSDSVDIIELNVSVFVYNAVVADQLLMIEMIFESICKHLVGFGNKILLDHAGSLRISYKVTQIIIEKLDVDCCFVHGEFWF